MRLYTKILSFVMFATLSFSVANFVSAKTIFVGDSYTISSRTESAWSVRGNGFQLYAKIGGSDSLPISYNPTFTDNWYWNSTWHNLTITNIPVGTYTQYQVGNTDGGYSAEINLSLPETLEVVPIPVRTATSTLTDLADPIISGGTSLANTVFQFAWPIILVMGIFYGFVKLLRNWIAKIIMRNNNTWK